jgi:hypothetical protein
VLRPLSHEFLSSQPVLSGISTLHTLWADDIVLYTQGDNWFHLQYTVNIVGSVEPQRYQNLHVEDLVWQVGLWNAWSDWRLTTECLVYWR